MGAELEKVERALRAARQIEEVQRRRLDRPLQLLEEQRVWKGADAHGLAEALTAQRSRLRAALHRIVEDLEERAPRVAARATLTRSSRSMRPRDDTPGAGAWVGLDPEGFRQFPAPCVPPKRN